MDLETFRAIDVDIDLANDFVPDVILSANDYNGRCIVARVTNGGVSVNGDNLSARLLFNTAPGISPGGYVTMAAVASSPTATWQVPVPSDALAARQVMLCVQIVDSDDNLVCSRNFRGIVDRKLMDDGAPESVNELNRLWEGIDALENIDASVAADGTVSVTAPDGTVTTSTAVPTAVSAANSAASAANTAATAANTAASAASTAATSANVAAARAEEAAKPTEEMFASYHELLKAGASEGIASDANPVQSSFLHRASGSAEGVRDGIATIECIKGNTVGWNQLANKNLVASPNITGFTYTESTNTGSGTSGSSNNWIGKYFAHNDIIKVGHKYLHSSYVASSVAGMQATVALYGNSSTITGNQVVTLATANKYEHIATIFTVTELTSGFTSTLNRVVFTQGTASALEGATVSIKDFMLFDLTAMFGAGNEPSTVAEFEALYPLPYYEYNLGALKPVMFEGVETVGFNQWDEEWEAGNIGIDGSLVNNAKKVRSKNFIPVIPGNAYTLECSVGNSVDVRYYDAAKNCLNTETSWWSKTSPKTFDSNVHYIKFIIGSDSVPVTSLNPGDICIHLKWSGYRDGEHEEYWKAQRAIAIAEHFPTGMKAAGTAADMLYKDHADHVIGSVDLGTLTWAAIASVPGKFYTNSISDIKLGDNLECLKYATSTAARVEQIADKAIWAHGNAYGSHNLVIYDSSFAESTAADFKASLSGVMLYYELATPTTEVIDPPLNLGYKVSDFGTERVMLADGVISAPPIFEIAYGYTAESLRDAAASIVAPVENHLAQDNYAIGSYLVRNGVLYKVTAAIARNEAIVPGTNVTATTVMAEIAAING